jgi:hypothetical protein
MALGDGIRRNIAHVDPAERAMLRDAIKELNHRYYPGNPGDMPPGGVSWWFKQDEIHQATHVHGGPEFLPWHREITNRFEALIREINPQLSLHYWDFKDDPRNIPNGNIGGGNTGTVNLFDPDPNLNVMGSPGIQENVNPNGGPMGEPWLGAGFYDPLAGTSGHPQDRDVSGNPVDPPKLVMRPSNYPGPPPSPLITAMQENHILGLQEFGPAVPTNHQDGTDPNFVNNVMPNYFRTAWETIHNTAHPYFADISPHDAFRDPFVFLLHSNVDRIFAMWQCDPMHPERLDPNNVYGLEGNLDVDVIAVGVHSLQNLTHQVEPWSTGHGEYHDIRPWEPTHENQGSPHDYHDLSVVAPPCYDTLPTTVRVIAAENPGNIINFNDVPQGETASRAAVFEIFACGTVTLQVSSGPNAPYSVQNPPGSTVVVSPGAHQMQVARIWFQCTGAAPGPTPNGSVTIHCVETNQDFVFSIHGDSIARPTVGVMLVLDQSGSMGWLAGIDASTKRIDVLHNAAANFCQLVQANNGVGMVSFDQASYPGFNVTALTGAPADPNLMNMVTTIGNLQPQGATSIGNGIALGRNTLNPVNGYAKKAMIVFTDGLQNTPLYIADVMGSLDAQTFAIGLGTAQQVSAGALNAITSQTGGYVLLSGTLSPAIDDQFRLRKYFLQVLAGVLNTSVVTDPNGTIFPGVKIRIPFQLSEADIDSTAILLTDQPGINFAIETPAGDVMTPVSAPGLGAAYGIGTNMSYYRFTLPLALGANPARAGTWYAILEMAGGKGARDMVANQRGGRGIRYSFNAHAFTNLKMDARLSQNSLQPGAALTISAALTEYSVPVEHRATVRAELELPDNSRVTLALSEGDAGHFQANTTAILPGVYRVRVVASGITMRGIPFTREQLLSAITVLGGDNPPLTSGPSTTAQDEDLCKLLHCLLGPNSLGRILAQHDVDPKAVLSCIEMWCKARLSGPTAQELAEREGTA